MPSFSAQSFPVQRERSRRVDFQALRCARFICGLLRERGGAVFAVIVNNDNRELPGIILFRYGRNCLGDSRGLIASWNDSNDVRPVFELSRFDFVFA